jgi:uncharacterized low-complexity protein
MKTLRIAATCVVALSVGYVGHAFAQQQPAPVQTEQTSQDVGGIADASRGETGGSMGMSRQQVYQDLLHSEQSGQSRQLSNGLYHGK